MPEVLFVAAAVFISHLCAYRGGRSAVVGVLEVMILVTVFVVHRIALNIATGHMSSLWLPRGVYAGKEVRKAVVGISG